MKQLYRQGDVLFEAIAALPAGERKVRENGVAAYGEVTGHSHQLAVADRVGAQVFEMENGGLYVSVSEEGGIGIGGATFVHEEHAPITLPHGDFRITIQKEYSPESIRSVLD